MNKALHVVAVLDAVFGAGRVLAERGKGANSALFAWYETSGTALHHRPDAVVVNYKGPGTYPSSSTSRRSMGAVPLPRLGFTVNRQFLNFAR